MTYCDDSKGEDDYEEEDDARLDSPSSHVRFSHQLEDGGLGFLLCVVDASMTYCGDSKGADDYEDDDYHTLYDNAEDCATEMDVGEEDDDCVNDNVVIGNDGGLDAEDCAFVTEMDV